MVILPRHVATRVRHTPCVGDDQRLVDLAVRLINTGRLTRQQPDR